MQPPIYTEIAYPYQDNLTADIRLIGYPAFMNPFVQNTSSSRGDMYAGHQDQALSIVGAEFPRIFTGMEGDVKNYLFDSSARNQDAEILAVIPKYPPRTGIDRLGDNPSTTVIYKGLSDGLVHYCTVDSFTLCSDGYGYPNRLTNQHLLAKGNPLDKGVVLQSPPELHGNKVMFGTNLQTCYLTLHETIEDAMLISKSAAAKMETTAYYKRTINLRSGEIPLNRYGDEIDYKLVPDIGEMVNDDGVIFSSRPVSLATFCADAHPGDLRSLTMHDRSIYAPGGMVVDIDVFIPKSSSKVDQTIYAQLLKYHRASLRYWELVIENYHQFRQANMRMSPAFDSLVHTAMGRLLAAGQQVKGLPHTKQVQLLGHSKRPIEFIQLDITYAVRRPLENGFKLAGRNGHKGVVCRIAEDEDMPTDQYGFRAQLVIDPGAVPARMNTGQWNEQGINRTSVFVQRKMNEVNETSGPLAAAEVYFEYLTDINPNYAALVQEECQSDQAKAALVREILRNGIHLNIPPFLNTMLDASILLKLQEKWGVKFSPVTYTIRDRDGSNPRVFTTEEDVCIGEKYILTLCKLPEPSACSVARVSHFGAAVKSPSDLKDTTPISISPIRFGEDELRIRAMDVDTDEDMRLMSRQANSPKGVAMTVEAQLKSEYPTRIDRIDISNEELVSSNSVLGMFRHYLATLGIESRNVQTDLPLTLGVDIPESLDELIEDEEGDDESVEALLTFGPKSPPPSDDDLTIQDADDEVNDDD